MQNISTKSKYVVGILRVVMGWIFLWAFLDKTFGLGFATPVERAWINGGSPTTGFLTNATQGPFADFFQNLAGLSWVDPLFMIGLLGIGLSLLLGIMVRIGSLSGIVLMILMYVAVLWPENNPFIDDHIVYAVVLLLFITCNAGKYFGFGKIWSRISIVRKIPILK